MVELSGGGAAGDAGVGRGEPSTHDTGTAAGSEALATSMGELARTLQEEQAPDEVLVKIVRAAVELIPGVDEGLISVVFARQRVESVAASGDLPRRVDAAQMDTGQGPCLDAAFEQHTVRVPDMRLEKRWPAFAQRAAAAGAVSMLSFQLYVEADNLGALNLYANEPNAFTDESEHVGLLFASHAAVAFAAAKTQGNLAWQSRPRSDRAGQGILMERFKITGPQAFDVLVHASQVRNRKLATSPKNWSIPRPVTASGRVTPGAHSAWVRCRGPTVEIRDDGCFRSTRDGCGSLLHAAGARRGRRRDRAGSGRGRVVLSGNGFAWIGAQSVRRDLPGFHDARCFGAYPQSRARAREDTHPCQPVRARGENFVHHGSGRCVRDRPGSGRRQVPPHPSSRRTFCPDPPPRSRPFRHTPHQTECSALRGTRFKGVSFVSRTRTGCT